MLVKSEKLLSHEAISSGGRSPQRSKKVMQLHRKFIEKEIDGWALLESKWLGEDSTLEKLGITTIGKKERFKRELGALKLVVKGRYLIIFHNDMIGNIKKLQI